MAVNSFSNHLPAILPVESIIGDKVNETDTDFPLRLLDLTVNSISGEINKACREISEKHFKFQLFAYFCGKP